MTRAAPAAPVHQVAGPDSGAPTVLLVHGMSDTWQSWRHLVARLPATWRLFAAELPWKAGTDHHWRRRGTPGGWLAATVDAMTTPPDIVVGHSLGANAVLEMLATEPAVAPRGAMLIAPFYCPPDLPITWAVHERAQANFVQIIDEGLRNRLGSRLAELDAATLASMRDIMVDRIGPVGFTALFDHFTATAGLPLHAVTVPTKVLTGGRDPSLDGPCAGALRAQLPDADIVVEPDFHHFCHLDRAAEVARHITVFVEQVCPDPAIRGGTP
ncbi:alpha/beta fold hydrolase [Micromonospora robiginosa]|uniref:Alpha/beta hydrolase n=1 Tax=Micromonospora robiginosa TaxID=2749844 RepID=A0A7L6B225_9ACTN|nr:alpha/beta hydrolase [Micromonospora ferruginea]QLQ35891.1 alpha/beta hydrolase [Micromonospora ferruginea]